MPSVPNKTDLLLSVRAMPRIAAALRARKEMILERWQREVHQTLPDAHPMTVQQVRDTLPLVLDKLAEVLVEADPETVQDFHQLTRKHGAARFHEDFDMQELLAEYRLLRVILIDEVMAELQGQISVPDVLTLDVGVDIALQQAVVAFVNHQNQQLRAAAEAEAKFLSFVSHDLRNRLNGITLLLEVIRRKLANAPEYADDVADLRSAQSQMLETIAAMERLLQAERLRKGAAVPQVGLVNLQSVASAVARELAPQAAEKHLEIRVGVPADAVVESDGQILTLILHNLVHNAIKYSQKGIVRIEAVPCGEGECAWTLFVADQGPGIQPAHRERLFGAFQRGETHGQGGIGLGLAIVAHAARALGAQASVESEPGKGATFKLVLPRATHR